MSEGDARIYVCAFLTGIIASRIPWMGGYGILILLALLLASAKIAPWVAGRNALKNKEGR